MKIHRNCLATGLTVDCHGAIKTNMKTEYKDKIDTIKKIFSKSKLRIRRSTVRPDMQARQQAFRHVRLTYSDTLFQAKSAKDEDLAPTFFLPMTNSGNTTLNSDSSNGSDIKLTGLDNPSMGF
jgi:hypothetical protein